MSDTLEVSGPVALALKGCVARREPPQFIRRSREGLVGGAASRMNQKAAQAVWHCSREIPKPTARACAPERRPVPRGNRRCPPDRQVSLRGLAQFCGAAVGASPPFGPGTLAAADASRRGARNMSSTDKLILLLCSFSGRRLRQALQRRRLRRRARGELRAALP